jgi:hypothetical protein
MPAELDAETGEVFTNVREWMAAVILLTKQGHLPNVQIGDDEDSQQFAAGVVEQNPDWEPGQVPVVPPPAEVFQRPIVSSPLRRDPIVYVPARFMSSGRPRGHRSRSRTAQASRDGPEGDPDPDSLAEIPPAEFWRAVDAWQGAT